MAELFKKAAAFSDLHLGLKSNSVLHNQDCEEFIDWFCETAKKENCDTGFFLGDYHHNRTNINIATLASSIRCLEKLGQTFEQFFFFPGNHDLFYKDRRDIHSVDWGRHIPGITIIDKPTTMDGVTMMPWLVGDEWKTIPKLKSRYVFGHFELPLFLMNAHVAMPDHGQLQGDHFHNQEYVFSGHFHKRQHRKNIVYIGNAFPHNYADAGDNERGMMIMDWGGIPQYHSWKNQPIYRNYKLSEIINEPDKLLSTKMHTRVIIDIPISFEEANLIRETFIPQYNLRELVLISEKVEVDADVVASNVNIEPIDTIVFNQINAIDSEAYDKNLLPQIYRDL